MFKKGNKKKEKKQSGLVSLIVVSILAVVLGLVAVGFSQLMDREARRALDNELSAQAYYAAIAGVNDARAYLAATEAQGLDGSLKGCSDWKSTTLGPKYFTDKLDSSGISKYSCVSIDTSPSNLSYTIPTDQSVTFKVNDRSMDRMYFGWQSADNSSSFVPLVAGGATGSLPQLRDSSNFTQVPAGATGVLEASLYVPVGATTQPPPNWPTDTQSILSGLSRTYYMYPNNPGGQANSVDYTSQNGNFVPGNCTAPGTDPLGGSITSMCNTYIDNMNGAAHNLNYTYYVRLTARYAPIVVKIQASSLNGGGGQTPISNISNAQAIVDVTGQGTDVLQRIRARISLIPAVQQPAYGIQSMAEICKGFDVEVLGPVNGQPTYGDAGVDSSISSSYNYNSACVYPAGGGTVGSVSGVKPHHGLPSVLTPFPLVNATLSAVPVNIYTGQSSTFTWTSTGARSCSGSQPPGGPLLDTGGAANSPPSGVTLTFPTVGTYQYTVTCGGTPSNPVTINVSNPPKPTDFMRVNGGPGPVTVNNGGSANLSWGSSSASSCIGNGFSTGGSTSGGPISTGALSSGAHPYSVTCYDFTGRQPTTSNTVTVFVNPPCQATASHSGNTAFLSSITCGNVTYTGSGSYQECDFIGPVSQGCYTVPVSWSNSSYTFPSSGNAGTLRWVISNYKATFSIFGTWGSTTASVSW